MDAPTDWVRSAGKYALDFDGSNDYVSCGQRAGDTTEAGTFSISAWAYARSYNGYAGIISRDASAPFAFAIRVGYGIPSILCDGVSLTASGTVATLQWVHHAVVVTPSRRIYYVNRSEVINSTAAYTITANSDELRIGTDFIAAADRCWNGLLDDIAIFSRALTPGEIRLLATRRGIAYEARRDIVVGSSGFSAYWARRQNQIIGGGV
jgi:hypothetical protein